MKRAAQGIWLTGAGLLAVYPIGALALRAAGYELEMRFPQFHLGAAAFLLVLGAALICMKSQTRLCKAAAVFSALAGVLVGMFVGLMALFSDFSYTEVLKTLASPSGDFEARVIDVDQGALGGETLVDVRDCRFSLDFGFCVIRRRDRRVYTGPWGEGEKMEIAWRGDESLIVGGHAYQLDEN